MIVVLECKRSAWTIAAMSQTFTRVSRCNVHNWFDQQHQSVQSIAKLATQDACACALQHAALHAAYVNTGGIMCADVLCM